MQIGNTYGKLLIIDINGKYAICQCECGQVKRIRKTSLTLQNKPTISCGCIQKQKARYTGTHTIAKNSKKQIECNMAYNTNFQVITSDKPPKNNTSGTKGVSWDESRKMFETYIYLHGKKIHLGRYTNIERAIKVRKQAEEKYFKPLINERDKQC